MPDKTLSSTRQQEIQTTFANLPFCMGPQGTPNNPQGIPDVLPLSLAINSQIPRIEQIKSDLLATTLEKAYRFGIEMGTPLAETELGSAYADDFIQFVDAHMSPPGRALEIGAGVGYISYRLNQSGWHTDTIEPGSEYTTSWEKYGLEVINEFFPNKKAKGPYDLIVFYAVLEHIDDIESFLEQVKSHLTPNGKIILSVPNCQLEIENGDPSMLLHEHYHYFTPASLKRSMGGSGLTTHVEESGYGRAIYAVASVEESTIQATEDPAQHKVTNDFFTKLSQLQTCFDQKMNDAVANGTVGIYCPARALSLLHNNHDVRFFDDSEFIQGKYYPPFKAQIESRNALVEKPVDTLFIMSWTFAVQLRNTLTALLPKTKIITMDEIA